MARGVRLAGDILLEIAFGVYLQNDLILTKIINLAEKGMNVLLTTPYIAFVTFRGFGIQRKPSDQT